MGAGLWVFWQGGILNLLQSNFELAVVQSKGFLNLLPCNRKGSKQSSASSPEIHSHQWRVSGLHGLQVYKAIRGGSQPVAVKVLHDREEGPDFGQEIALLKACRHSNIVAFQVCASVLLGFINRSNSQPPTPTPKGLRPSRRDW